MGIIRTDHIWSTMRALIGQSRHLLPEPQAAGKSLAIRLATTVVPDPAVPRELVSPDHVGLAICRNPLILMFVTGNRIELTAVSIGELEVCTIKFLAKLDLPNIFQSILLVDQRSDKSVWPHAEVICASVSAARLSVILRFALGKPWRLTQCLQNELHGRDTSCPSRESTYSCLRCCGGSS